MRRTTMVAVFLAALLVAEAVDAGDPIQAAVPAGEIAPERLVEGDAALGEYLSGECVTCHQISGNFDGIPSIVGWPAYWFVEAMNEFRHKRRANPVMQTIAGRYSAEEIAALAVYFERIIKHPPH